MVAPLSSIISNECPKYIFLAYPTQEKPLIRTFSSVDVPIKDSIRQLESAVMLSPKEIKERPTTISPTRCVQDYRDVFEQLGDFTPESEVHEFQQSELDMTKTSACAVRYNTKNFTIRRFHILDWTIALQH